MAGDESPARIHRSVAPISRPAACKGHVAIATADPDARERRRAAILVGAAWAFRLFAVFRQRVNSDEPQHLHVVWAWTQGLLPYRDVFDNHMPLFHILAAPVLRVVGERPTAVLWMRLLVLPLWVLALWLVFRIGRALFSTRVGVWAAAVGGLWPAFFRCSLEFRPDLLWAVLWLGTLTILVEGRLTPRHGLAAGTLLGAAVGVSMKSVMMIAGLAVAFGAALLLAPDRAHRRRAWMAAFAGAAGLLVVPAAITVFFASRGALDPYLYGVIWHNALPGLGPHPWSWGTTAALVVAVPTTWHVVRRIARGSDRGPRRAVVLLAAATYLGVLSIGWPLVTQQDQLPIVPLVALFAVAALARLRAARGLLVSVVAVELALLVADPGVWRKDALEATTLTSDVLRLTDASDFVLDLKGESVFRPRSTYWVLEGITKERFRRGLIPDDLAADLVATRTGAVAGWHWGLPARSRRFVAAHYLRVRSFPRAGTLLVAGRWLDPGSEDRFDIPFSLSYALLDEHGARPQGLLDGAPYDGPRVLDAGAHVYQPAPGEGRVVLLWEKAAQRGFVPPFERRVS